jgi:hypothetical protein
MSRSCLCGGNNENCRYCNGSGILPNRLDSVVGRPANKFGTGEIGIDAHVGGEQSQVNHPALVLCPKGCKLFIKPEALAGHIARVHKPKWKPPKVCFSAYTNCPNCNTKLRKDALQKHIKRWHANRLSTAGTSVVNGQTSSTFESEGQRLKDTPQLSRIAVQKPTSSIPPAKKHQIIVGLPGQSPVVREQIAQSLSNAKLSCVPCPHCAAPVRSDRIQRHMLNVHKAKYSAVPDALAKVSVGGSPMVTCPNCQTKLRPERLERHIDWVHSGRRKGKKKKRKKGKANFKREPRLVSGGLPGLGKRR